MLEFIFQIARSLGLDLLEASNLHSEILNPSASYAPIAASDYNHNSIFKNLPVWLSFTSASSSGVPANRICPPPRPPSGPTSMT